MSFLFRLLLGKFQINLTLDYYELESKDFLFKIASFPLNYWLGYLNTLENVTKSFNTLVYPFLKSLIIIILSFVKIIKLYKENENNIELNEDQKKFLKSKFKELNRIILKRFAEIYDKFPDFPDIEILTKALLDFKKQKIEKMASEAKGNDGFLSIFLIWSEQDSYRHYFIEYSYLKKYIFSMYSARNPTQKTLDLLNKIVLNLLGVRNEEDNNAIEEEPQGQTITENILYDIKGKIFDTETVKLLLESIRSFFISQKNLNKTKKRRWRPSLSLIRILLYISKIAGSDIEEEYIDHFIMMFLPLIDYKYLTKSLRIENLHSAKNQKFFIQREKNLIISREILKAFSTLLSIKKSTENLAKYFNHICNLILNLKGHKFRILLIDCLKNFNLEFLGLTPKSIEILGKMNTFDKLIDKNYNYEVCIPLILEFNSTWLFQLTISDIQVILYHLFSVLEDDEMSLRGSALSSFKIFMELIQDKWDKFEENQRKQIKKFISMIIIPNALNKIKKNARCKDEYKMKSYFLLFDCLLQGFLTLMDLYEKGTIFNCPLDDNEKKNFYLDLVLLLNKTDPEQNFFPLIFDLKLSKKIKGINILIKKIKEKENVFSTESIAKVLIPLLNYLIFQKCLEINDPNNKMPKSSSTISNYKTLLEGAIESFGLLTRNFKWNQFQKSLKSLIIMLERNENQAEKVVVKLICSLLNNLTFELNDVLEQVNAEMQKNKENILKKISFFASLSSENNNVEKQEENEMLQQDEILIERNIIKLNLEPITPEEQEKHSIYFFLRTKVLIPLKHHMHEAKKNRNVAGEDQKIRVFLAVAIVKVIFFLFIKKKFFE